MQHRIENIDGFRVVGMRIETSVQKCQKVLPGLWKKFMARDSEVKGPSGSAGVHYGLCRATSIQKCTFTCLCCRQTSADAEIPEDMVADEVPAGKYAVFTHKGPFANVGETYGSIYHWLPGSELKQRRKDPWFERYDSKSTDKDGSVMEIWIPVK
ncbi:GyrI-like domain-containing protein [Candidatus Woesearchaeota archaeon]|nr:GyrI-like domain-containing protein [Candidatus Woesearchaeota archaeon]